MGKQWLTLFFGGSKITADGDCSQEIKRCLLLGRKVMTNLDSVLNCRDITLSTKVHLVKAMFFQWSYMDVRVRLQRRLSAKELMLLNCGVGEDSWESLDCKEIQPVHPKGDQSWVFIGRTDVEAETPIFGHLMQRADSFEKTLILGKIESRRRGWQRMRWLEGITDSVDVGFGGPWELVMDRETLPAAVHGDTKSRTWLSEWIELKLWKKIKDYCS